ncbi:MAG: ATP-binding protein [Kiritimatiellae bacterium]|nr:ATP-binding protein [Kiritimatiellia bacterium]
MKEIHVQAQKDHIYSLCSSSAILAIAELIWNALDADALDVKIDIIQNSLDAIDAVRVTDDGLGINALDIEQHFGNLGGSWKRNTDKTPRSGRVLHGCKGRGRFKAFALGQYVEWNTTQETSSGLQSFVISGDASDPSQFNINQLNTPGPATGTEVMITNVRNSVNSLRDTTAVLQQLSTYFALYLKAYPNVKIYFQGLLVNPVIVQKASKSYTLKSSTGSSAELEVIEWRAKKTKAKIILCNPEGFALHEIDAGVRPGNEFNFTAYLISPRFEELHAENLLIVEELHPEINAFLDAARNTLRTYFRKIRETMRGDVLKQWTAEKIYPFDPFDDENVEARIQFDRCARTLQTYSNGFEGLGTSDKRLIFQLLKNSLSTDPQGVIELLNSNLKIPAAAKNQPESSL